MSYKYVSPENIIGVRKVKWDGLWHVLYNGSGKKNGITGNTWDRVTRQEAMSVLRKISQNRN